MAGRAIRRNIRASTQWCTPEEDSEEDEGRRVLSEVLEDDAT
jgi:hypothetical protein